MSLENGILGFLAMKPMSGYDIKKLFDISASYFWPANQSQIYRSLKTLEKDGLIKPENNDEIGPQGRRAYAITDKGRKAYLEKLYDSSIAGFITRDLSTMRLFFSGALTEKEQLDFISAQIQGIEQIENVVIEDFEKNLRKFLYTTGLEEDDRRLRSATYARQWGLIQLREYAKYLTEIKTQLTQGDKE